MNKIEAIFGGVLLLAVIAAASFMFIQRGLPQIGGGSVGTVAVADELDPSVFSGDYRQDMCTCYEQGYSGGAAFLKRAGSGATIDDDPQFKTGYSACRAAIGMEGASAWSAGWGNGHGNLRSQRKCSFYLKSNNIR